MQTRNSPITGTIQYTWSGHSKLAYRPFVLLHKYPVTVTIRISIIIDASLNILHQLSFLDSRKEEDQNESTIIPITIDNATTAAWHTRRFRFKWQRRLIVWFVFSLYSPFLSENPEPHRCRAFAVCSISVALPSRHLFHFYRLAAPVLRFLRFSSRCCFFEFSFVVRQTRLHSCFFRILAFFLLPRFWQTLANIPSSWIPSWPIDRGFEWQTCPALSMSVCCFFAIDHSPVIHRIVKFDEKQRIHDDRKQRRADYLLSHNTYYNLKNSTFYLIHYVSIIRLK